METVKSMVGLIKKDFEVMRMAASSRQSHQLKQLLCPSMFVYLVCVSVSICLCVFMCVKIAD